MTEIEKFVRFNIKDMEATLEWTASDRMADYSNDDRRDWGLRTMRDAYEAGRGALRFARVYEESIDEEEYQLLNARISDSYHDLSDKVWDLWRHDSWQHC